MELVRQRGQLPCFRYEQFCVCEKKYQQQEEKICWNDWESLREFVSSLETNLDKLSGISTLKPQKNGWIGTMGNYMLFLGMGGLFSVSKAEQLFPCRKQPPSIKKKE